MKQRLSELVRYMRYDLPSWVYQFTIVEWLALAVVVVVLVDMV